MTNGTSESRTDRYMDFSRRRYLKTATAAGVGVTGLSGCLDSLGGGQTNPIKVGFASALTGPYDAEAEAQRQGAELAIKEINNNGGIDGRDVELIVRDTELNPDTASRRVQDLTQNENVDMLTGSISGGIIVIFNNLAKSAGIPMFAGPTGMRTLRQAENYYEGTFAKFVQSHQYARAIPTFIEEELGAKSVFGMYADYSWGQEIWDLSSTWYEENTNVSVEGVTTHPLGHSDFASQINEARESGADVLHVTNFGTDTSNSLKQMREFELTEDMTLVFTMSGMGIARRAGKEAWEDVYVGMQWHPDVDTSATEEFNRKLDEEFGVFGDAYHETPYVNLHEFKRGAEAGGSVAMEDIVSGLRGTEFNYLKGQERWRECDNQSVQEFYILKGKPISEQENENDIFDIEAGIGGTNLMPDCSYVGWE